MSPSAWPSSCLPRLQVGICRALSISFAFAEVFDLSKPQFPLLKMGQWSLKTVVKIQWLRVIKVLI